MYRGISSVTLDSKGRMAMPSKYRQCLQEQCAGKLVVTVDTEEHCLLIYGLPDWELIEGQIESLPSFNRAARRIQRLLIGYATEVEMDSHSRILLPTPLREYAKLSKQSLLVGQGKKLELWDEQHWQTRREVWLDEDSQAAGADIPEQLKNISL